MIVASYNKETGVIWYKEKPIKPGAKVFYVEKKEPKKAEPRTLVKGKVEAE